MLGILLFLMSSTSIVSQFPIQFLTISFKVQCPGAAVVCFFIEVFEDEVIYEQLLTRYDACVPYTQSENPKDRLDPKNYFFESHNYPFEFKLPPILVGRRSDNDTFTTNFQITHDCSTNGEILCLRESEFYDGTYTANKITGFLKDYGTIGPCSNRWEGSHLWKKYKEKMENLGKKNEEDMEVESRTENVTVVHE